MLKYYDVRIGALEIPGEVSLVFHISNCPFQCRCCPTPECKKDEGDLLTEEILDVYLDSVGDDASCLLFMGGDLAPDIINELAAHVREKYPEKRVAWFSEEESVSVFTEYQNFDYLKFGRYNRKYGLLSSRKTNQRLYRVDKGLLRNITAQLW